MVETGDEVVVVVVSQSAMGVRLSDEVALLLEAVVLEMPVVVA